MPREYRTIQEVAGPLMLVEGVEGVSYNELGEIELASGEVRRCKVLEINGTDALVQLFDSAAGINLSDSKVRFLGRSMELAVSPDMLSRVFDGMGRPIDDGPDILPQKRLDINGLPMNPAARNYPQEFIQTGVLLLTVLILWYEDRSFLSFQHQAYLIQILRRRLQDKQRFAVQQSPLLLFLLQWVLPLKNLIILLKALKKQVPLTERLCLLTLPTTQLSSEFLHLEWL